MAYAWSPMVLERDENGLPTKTIEVGDSVSKSDVGDDYDYLVEVGAIRDEEYPEDLSPQQSPAEVDREQVRAMLAGELDEEARDEIIAKIEEERSDPDTLEAVSGGSSGGAKAAPKAQAQTADK